MVLLQPRSKREFWRKIRDGILGEDVASCLSPEDIPAALRERWRKRQEMQEAVKSKGLELYATRSEFDQPENVQRLLNLLCYTSGSDYRTQSAALTLEKGSGNGLEGGLVAAYCLELRDYPPQLLTLDFGFTSHALYVFRDAEGFKALHKRRKIVSEKLKIHKTLEDLAHYYIQRYKEEGYRTAMWGIADLQDLTINWRQGWPSKENYIVGLDEKISQITHYNTIKD